MAIKKESKNIEEEDSLDKKIRLRKEKKTKEALDAKQKIVDDALEQKRMESIIFPYLDDLNKKLKEKNSHNFWTFPDRSGFKKMKDYNRKKIQKFMDKDPKKYADRNVVEISIITFHRSEDDSKYSFKNMGTFLGVDISVNPIDKNGKMKDKGTWGGRFVWNAEDFKTTKISFKLLEKIMKIVVDEEMSFASITGKSITRLLDKLKKNGYNLDDVLSPLAGV
jgi:hypothetical protein